MNRPNQSYHAQVMTRKWWKTLALLSTAVLEVGPRSSPPPPPPHKKGLKRAGEIESVVNHEKT